MLEYDCFPQAGAGTRQEGPCGHLEELQEDWKGTRTPLEAGPARELAPRAPAHASPPAPGSGHVQEGWPFFSVQRTLGDGNAERESQAMSSQR